MFFNIPLIADWQAIARTHEHHVNNLTAKSFLAGTKHFRSEGWLAKHKRTNIPTMLMPYAPPSAWFFWPSIPHSREPQ
jgi:hypothetical protein